MPALCTGGVGNIDKVHKVGPPPSEEQLRTRSRDLVQEDGPRKGCAQGRGTLCRRRVRERMRTRLSPTPRGAQPELLEVPWGGFISDGWAEGRGATCPWTAQKLLWRERVRRFTATRAGNSKRHQMCREEALGAKCERRAFLGLGGAACQPHVRTRYAQGPAQGPRCQRCP